MKKAKFLVFFFILLYNNRTLVLGNTINLKPKIIGVVADYLPNKENIHNYTTYPIHGLRTQYIDNLSEVCKTENVVFVMIPCDVKQIDKFSNIIDGLILIGGWDIDPKFYNQTKHEKSGEDSIVRTEFEIQILKNTIKQQKPIFTICRGTQLANIALGGDMIQDIPSTINTNINHSATKNGIGYFDIAHKVKLSEKSLIYKILNKDEIGVNSSHHQALGKIGNDLVVTGVSPNDNIPEVIEMPNYPNFFLGVQWHPEFLATDDDKLIIKAFCHGVFNSQS